MKKFKFQNFSRKEMNFINNSNKPDVFLSEDIPSTCLMDYKVCYDDSIKFKRSYELSEDERISLVSDNMFKVMFLNESRKKYPCKLLSYFLNVDYDCLIENLEYYKNDISRNNLSSKGEVADFVAKIGNTFISIEMNNRNTLERNEDYVNRLSAANVEVGKDYKYHIVVQININNFYFENHDQSFMVFKNVNELGELYTRKVYVDVFLPILRKKLYNEGIEALNEKEKIILALYESSKSKALELSKGDKELMEYYEEQEKISKGEDLISAYDHEVENFNLWSRTRL